MAGRPLRHLRNATLPEVLSVQPGTFQGRKVIYMLVDIGGMEDRPSTPALARTLVRQVPSLETHRCSYKTPGGFVRRLYEGTYFGHILEHLALELQSLDGDDVYFGRTRGAGPRGVYHVLYEVKDYARGAEAGQQAFELLLSAYEQSR